MKSHFGFSFCFPLAIVAGLLCGGLMAAEASTRWALATDTAARAEEVADDAFSGFWVECEGFSLEVAPDTITRLEVTAAPSKTVPEGWYPVRVKTCDGETLDGRMDYTMASCKAGTGWEDIVKTKALKSLTFSANAAAPERPEGTLTAAITLVGGAKLALTQVGIPRESVRVVPLKFRRDKPSSLRGAFLAEDHEMFSARLGAFAASVSLPLLTKVAKFDPKLLTGLAPWDGPADKRPKVLATVGKDMKMWPSDSIVGRGPHGWTRVDLGSQVEQVDFSGATSEKVPLKDEMCVGPAATVEDRLGVKLTGSHLHQTWIATEFTLFGEQALRNREAVLEVTQGEAKTATKVPFEQIASIAVKGEHEPLSVEVTKQDKTVVKCAVKPSTGEKGEQDLFLTTDFGYARIAWEDVRKITFAPPASEKAPAKKR